MSEQAWTGSWCPQCGPDVSVDEDGCCLMCGCDAVGAGAETALRLRAARDEARAEIARLTALLRKWEHRWNDAQNELFEIHHRDAPLYLQVYRWKATARRMARDARSWRGQAETDAKTIEEMKERLTE